MNESAESSLYDRIVGFLRTDLEEKSVVVRWVAWRLKLLYEIVEKFWWDNCFTFAASLAYTTLLALAPLAAVSLSFVSSFAVSKTTVLNFVFERLLPNKELAAVIETNIDTFAANAASVSALGIAALALFSIWVMSTIESAFNMIWKVDKPRPVINQFVAYWSTLTFAPILIAVSIIVTAKIRALVLSEDWAEYTYLQGFILKMIPYALTWIAFLLVYRLIPYTNVHLKPALYGAVIAGTMFEAAKGFFDWYVLNWSTYTAVYGALAVIPIFLFWLYVTWLIVLLGAVIAYAIQYPKEIHSVKHEGFDRTKYLNYYTLRLLIEATRAYRAGEGPLNPRAVQTRLEITGEFYSDILQKLKKLDLIEFVEGTDDTFLISRPPENILVSHLLANLNGEMLSASPEPLDNDRRMLEDMFNRIKAAVDEGIESLDILELTNRLGEHDLVKPRVELVSADRSETA